MKGFHGFQVDARPHKGEHVISTFPGGEGTLITLNTFHLRKVNTRCCLCLGKRGDGQSPESKEADDALGFKACDGNVHGLFIVETQSKTEQCGNQGQVHNQCGFLPGGTIGPRLLGIKRVKCQCDTHL